MTGKRVLLIESGQFLGGVICSLMKAHCTLSIIEAAPADVGELRATIQKEQPEIIVIDDTLHHAYLDTLLDTMRASDAIQVVVVNTNSNRVDVYRKEEIHVREPADFFAIL